MDDLNVLLQQHRNLQRTLPHAWNAFFARFGFLRPIQMKTIPAVLEAKSVLVMAPTAGGKTEAVVAPVCERLISENWRGLNVLVITPTRALVNDLYHRLEAACFAMNVRLGRKTSDHPLSSSVDRQILITTPESTESLLTFKREQLNELRVIIHDEIHLLDGTPRGDQMRCILARIERYVSHIQGTAFKGIQRIAMSATVARPRTLADAYLGEDAVIVSVGGQRAIQSEIVFASGDHAARAVAAIDGVGYFQDSHKILVFVNSRKQVDLSTKWFRTGSFANCPVYGHHGNLSKEVRENVEARFREDKRAICIATTTLEIGIDIGDIDLVVCMDPPFSLSSFLQRIGRGCRRIQGVTRVLCVARDHGSELMFRALIQQASDGIPPGPLPPFRRSVLVQQVLAYLKQVRGNVRTREQLVETFSSSYSPRIEPLIVVDVLRDMANSGLLEERKDIFQPASAGRDFIESKRIYSNIQPTLEIVLMDVDTGKTIGHVAGLQPDTDSVAMGGKNYKLQPGGSAFKVNVRSHTQDVAVPPQYRQKSLPYSFDVGFSLARVIGVPSETLLCIVTGCETIIMTWLGKLMNEAIAESLKRRGISANPGAFHIALNFTGTSGIHDLVEILHSAIADLEKCNPFGSMSHLDRVVDLGPCYSDLSPDMQRQAREDWLDEKFLKEWVTRLTNVEAVTSKDARYPELIMLI